MTSATAVEVEALAGEVARGADGEVGAVDVGVDATADRGGEAVRLGHAEASLFGGGDDRPGDRVLGAALGRGGQGEQRRRRCRRRWGGGR